MAKTPAQHKADSYVILQDEIRLGGKRWVTMSNRLTRAGHGLTLSEKRIVAAAVSKLNSKAVPPKDGVPMTKLTAAEYAETFNVGIDVAYKQLAEAGKKLYSRSITFYEPAYARNGAPIEPTFVQMRWVGQVKYHENEGWIELHWWPKLMQHLMGLKQQFTTYQLEQASALRSQYSWKLLELLMRFKDSGFAAYTVEDFCTAMDVPEKMQSDFAKIRIKVIEPAVKELIEKDGWEIEWEAIKAGRKVKALQFYFKKNPQQDLFRDDS